MKLQIERQNFLKSWQIAEKVSNIKSTREAISAVFIKAEQDGSVILEATDLKTYVKCRAEGVTVIEPGTALTQTAIFGNLLKKYSTDKFEFEFNRERGLFKAGTSNTRVTGIAVEIFPGFPNSEDAEMVCEIMASDLARIIAEGVTASSMPQDFPKYMGNSLVRCENGVVKIISTDGKRLSLSKVLCTTMKDDDLVLNSNALKELGRTLAPYGETVVAVLANDAMIWFRLNDVEFAIRRVESGFPNYEKILNDEKKTVLRMNCSEFSRIIDRIDIIAKTTISHIMAMALQPNQESLNGEVRITARAPELGTAAETFRADVEGSNLQLGFNVSYFQDGLKALGPGEIVIEFSGEEEQTRMYRKEGRDFLYMLMPARLSPQDTMTEEEIGDFRRNSEVSDEAQPSNQPEPQPEYQEPPQEYQPEQYNSEENNY